MFVMIRTFSIAKGSSSKMIERLNQPSPVEKASGLISKSVLTSLKPGEVEKVLVQIVWESKDAFLAWERSPEHLAMHRAKAERPDFILEVKVESYTLINEKRYRE